MNPTRKGAAGDWARRHWTRAWFAGFALIGLCSTGMAQAFNIDLDVFFGPPELGNGAPSDAFGAAANQVGRWNRVALGSGPYQLATTAGVSSNVQMQVQSGRGDFFGGGFDFAGNTGDYALLLNDAATVGTLVQGGSLTYTFSGLLPGDYDLYTYAVNISGNVTATPVDVPLATQNQIQIVTGPMPGNSFELLATHSTHRVSVTQGVSVSVSISQPPGLPHGFEINGFQIVPVPEFSSGFYFALLTIVLLLARMRATRR